MDHGWSRVRRVVATTFDLIGLRPSHADADRLAELDDLIVALFGGRSHPGEGTCDDNPGPNLRHAGMKRAVLPFVDFDLGEL